MVITHLAHLMPGSSQAGFTHDDPIRLLAHNLDFWLPPVTEVIQEILQLSPDVNDAIEPEPALLSDGSVLEGVVRASPRKGTTVWIGEADAAETTEWAIERADEGGRLRDILDAIRRNRVEDDFSNRWTFEREDFERKLYRKRSKIRSVFVELAETRPVQSPETEVVGQSVTAGFMALLDTKERQVVVLLNSGHTNLTQVGEMLGYSNHSPISKRLARIRREAERFFDQQ
jgi:hypothetical protein